MIFTSIEFALLFILSVFIFYLIPNKARKWFLLLVSAVFIAFNNWAYLAIAIGTSILTYISGLWIDKFENEKHRNWAFKTSLIAHLLILIAFKYFTFLESNFFQIAGWLGIDGNPNIKHIFLPLGISFYIFQSISYLTEIYWEEYEAEKKLGNFMLYMLFFMKFLSGPIERPYDFLPQISKPNNFDYQKVTLGLKLMGVGLLKKMIIADRIAPSLDQVFNSVQSFSGGQLAIASICYPLQLYFDFSAYTDIAIGGAAVLGFQLSRNFNRPFSAQTITDFWRRWHMSLSFWVRDYIYEPVAMQKRNWGKYGIYFSLFVTFLLLGLWHGDSWNFVIYGGIQGVVIIYEMITSKWRNKIGNILPNKLFQWYGIIRTYLIFGFSLLFFRIEKTSDIFYLLSHLFEGIKTSYKELNLGMKDHDIIMFILGTIIIFLYEFFNAQGKLSKRLQTSPTWLRWSFYYLFLIILVWQAKFGTDNFIYFQF